MAHHRGRPARRTHLSAAIAFPDEGDDDWLLSEEELAKLSDDDLAEYLAALEAATRAEQGWVLQERQQLAEDTCDALMAAQEVFELMYGGAGAGGKSEWLLWHQYHLALRFDGFSGLLLRTSFPELNRTAIIRSHGKFDRSLCKYNSQEHVWTFHNGSRLEFGYCETDRDVFQYDSAEYDCVAFDELTQHARDFVYRYLFSRLRTTMAKSVQGLVPHMVSGTNPHRAGAAWVKPRFVDIGPPEQVHRMEMELDTGEVRVIPRIFIRAKLSDNKYVNAAGYRQALAVLNPATRKAIEDGSWDVLEGQYFEEWNREIHVIEPFALEPWWRRFGGYDFGIHNPACHLWAAQTGDGDLIVYRELYGTEMTVRQQARGILDLEPATDPTLDYRVGDPSIWNRTGAGPPIAQQFADAGVIFRRANNARIDGWARLRDYLLIDPARPHIQLTRNGEPVMGAPKLYIFSTCTNLIRTLPMLVRSQKKPEDVDTDGEDHAGDALRYLVMSRPIRSRKAGEPETEAERRAHAREDRRKARESGTMNHPVVGDW